MDYPIFTPLYPEMMAYFALIKHAGATRAALITHVAPVVALAAGVIVLGERLTLWQLAGCVLILIGAALVLRPGERHSRVDHGLSMDGH